MLFKNIFRAAMNGLYVSPASTILPINWLYPDTFHIANDRKHLYNEKK